CISPRPSGRISAPRRSRPRLRPIGRASAASGAPANSSMRAGAAKPCARGARQPTPERLLLTRVLTAAVLLAAFIAALFLLDRGWFAVVVAIVVAIAGYEWARLVRTERIVAPAYAVGCA